MEFTENYTWYKTGSVSIIQGSKKVTGIRTDWLLAEIKQGDILLINNKIYEIDKVAGSEVIWLVNEYEGETVASADYAIIPRARAVLMADLAVEIKKAVTYWNNHEKLLDEKIQDIEKEVKSQGIFGKMGIWVDDDGDLSQDDDHIINPEDEPDPEIATDDDIDEMLDDVFVDDDF
ncbi:MAG: hypothetical protein IJQ56_08150 [Synergistaceae bacterium]|nr:hypothetical protein [Synergistaceae bacterium]